MRRMWPAAFGVALLSGVVVLAQDAAKVENGKKVYETNKCSNCHVIAGKGTPKIASALDGVGKRLNAVDLKKWLTETAAMEAKLPKKPMVKMSDFMKTKKLADADIDALVAYMQTLK